MAKIQPSVGDDGFVLPIMPPKRDGRVWAKLVRVMIFTPGFMAILLLKTGEPSAFGVTVELLMLACGTALVAGLFVGAQSIGSGGDCASEVGLWCGALVMELLAAVPFLCALPPLFYQLAHSTLLHAGAPGAVDVALGASELIPAVAVIPFMLYQLCGFGTLGFVVSKSMNWAINTGILILIVATYVANRNGAFGAEQVFTGLLVTMMVVAVFYGVLRLKEMQTVYDAHCPKKPKKTKDDDSILLPVAD
jgi:hypothetical protein